MKVYNPPYSTFKKRFTNDIIGSTIFYTILVAVITLVNKTFPILLSCFILPLLVYFFYRTYKKNSKYLKNISVGENGIEFQIVNQKEEVEIVEASFKDCRIKIPELVFASKYRRIFVLQIDIKLNGKFQTIHEQHEVGKWNLELFKEVYCSYCHSKGIPVSLSSIKRTGI